jgi:hypothetical protein
MKTPELTGCARSPALSKLLMVLAISSCSAPEERQGPPPGVDSGADGDAASGHAGAPPRPTLAPSRLPADFQCEPTLESIRENIFVQACGLDTCHGDNDAAWGLRLSVDLDFVQRSLVGIRGGYCPDWLLVAPGDPDASLLLEKLRTREPACGEPMPRGYEPLPAEALRCIQDWIEAL